MNQVSRPPRWAMILGSVGIAISLVAGSLVLVMPASAAVGLSGLEVAQAQKANCQLGLTKATSSAQRTRMQNCITDQTLIINAYATPSTTPPATTTAPPVTTTPAPTTVPPTTTPAPTTSPPPPTTTGCLANLAACGYPNAANTGPSGALSVVNGNVSLFTAGAVYENKDVNGCISVTAPGVVIRNVRVRCSGGYAIGTDGAADGNGARLTIADSEIDCLGTDHGTAIGDNNIDVARVDIHGCINGFDIDKNVTAVDTWIHNMSCAGSDPHTDGAQIVFGAQAVLFIHVVFDMTTATCATSAIITPGDPIQLTVDSSILAGGGYTVYCGNGSSGYRFTNNRFGVPGYGLTDSCGQTFLWLDNVRDANGAPVGRSG